MCGERENNLPYFLAVTINFRHSIENKGENKTRAKIMNFRDTTASNNKTPYL